MQFTLYTRKELNQTAKQYAKGHGKLTNWMIRITSESGHTNISLLLDCQNANGLTEQLSIQL